MDNLTKMNYMQDNSVMYVVQIDDVYSEGYKIVFANGTSLVIQANRSGESNILNIDWIPKSV